MDKGSCSSCRHKSRGRHGPNLEDMAAADHRNEIRNYNHPPGCSRRATLRTRSELFVASDSSLHRRETGGTVSRKSVWENFAVSTSQLLTPRDRLGTGPVWRRQTPGHCVLEGSRDLRSMPLRLH